MSIFVRLRTRDSWDGRTLLVSSDEEPSGDVRIVVVVSVLRDISTTEFFLTICQWESN